jgi:GntR family transcriptional regulator of vanillate catabolism
LLNAIPPGGFRLRVFSLADIRDAIEIRGVLKRTAARFAAQRLESPQDLGRAAQLV